MLVYIKDKLTFICHTFMYQLPPSPKHNVTYLKKKKKVDIHTHTHAHKIKLYVIIFSHKQFYEMF